MFVVRDCVHIKAPMERCFLLSTNLELAQRTLKMRVRKECSGGRRSTFARSGDRIVWRSWWLGSLQRHESVITRYEPPNFVEDTMVRGGFRRLRHDHRLIEIDGHVLLTETVRFSLPMGRAGRWAGRRVVVPMITAMLRRRLQSLRRVAETNDWKQYVETDE